MNLIQDVWIPVIRRDGAKDRIAPWQIVERDNPVVDVLTPRADFNGAMYQLLIGLLQTAAPPVGSDEWLSFFGAPPDEAEIKAKLSSFIGAFYLCRASEPQFLQDFDMPEGETKGVAALLIEAPGGKTLKDNLDHFVKGGQVEAVCESCAAIALFTLQTNAPSGGVGHRVGLRGGGPLTTLVMPQSEESTLWQKLWLNVLIEEQPHITEKSSDSLVFPWLAPTRISDKSGVHTTPEDTHPLQMYWGMPRRIRLDFENVKSGCCDICGENSDRLITQFKTKNYGVNYEGPWVHPLTPYRFDPDHKKPPLSLKGQQEGLGFRHWLGLAWQDDSNGDRAALVTRIFNEQKFEQLESEYKDIADYARLWCFGYDMDNMKARCWYEYQMPMLKIDSGYRDDFIGFVLSLIQASKDLIPALRGQIKQAWFSRPKDAKGDTSMIDHDFWQATEAEFYKQLSVLAAQPVGTRYMPAEVCGQWVRKLRQAALDVFDHWALEGEAEDLNMKRVIRARLGLAKKLKSIKSLKALDQCADAKEAASG